MHFTRLFRFPPELPANLRSNFTHLYMDISWWGLYAGATAAFLSIYATRTGATAQQIGLLTAGPATLSMLLSLPVGWMIRRYPARVVSGIAAGISRLLFLVYALLPVLFPLEQQFDAILITTLIITVPTTVVNISFSQFFMEGVPLEWRAMVVGMRGALFAILTFIFTLISGQILTWVPFPNGYQIVFFIGFIGGMMTTYHIFHVFPVAASNPLPV
jgi:MFS family permease